MRIVRYVSLALFLTYLIQHKESRGPGRLFERIRIDLPRWLEDNDYEQLREEVYTLVHCPFCLTAYTSMAVLLMPLPMRRWLEVWMVGYTMLWLEQEGYLKRLQFNRYIPFSGKVPTRGE